MLRRELRAQLSIPLFSVFALVLSLLAPISFTQANAAPGLVTCINLQTGKERISHTDKCRYAQEAQANWHKNPSDSTIASGLSAKVIVVCSNKESSPVSYQIIRKKCAKHQVTTIFSRSGLLPAKPVIAEAVSYGHNSASLKLAIDPDVNVDAPIVYYTITASRVDTKTASIVETQRIYFWRDLKVVINVLQALTSYTFTVTAANADGTSQVSTTSSQVTTRAYEPPKATTSPTTSPVVYVVGDTGPGGGKIFYAATTPFACGLNLTVTCTYLEAAPKLWNGPLGASGGWAQSTPIKYDTATVNNVSSPETATATGIGWGFRNTQAIILQGNTNTASSAAALANSYSVTVGGVLIADWHLPSKDELNQLCKWARGQAWTSDATLCDNTGLLSTDFFPGQYWSSSETAANAAARQFFTNGSVAQGVAPKNGNVNIRPVRAF